MKLLVSPTALPRILSKKAIESDFPIIEISKLAEKESWRKEINRPLYHIHKWWAKRLGSVFRAIILAAINPDKSDPWLDFYKFHNFKGKIVLDPFMGSGTTLGEALKLGCKAIGCDINPISTFLVQQALTKVSEDELRGTFVRLEQTVAKEIQQYHQTRDPETNALIPVLYYFWVKMVVTPEGESIPLFSNYIFSKNAYPQKKPTAQIICPICWNITENRFDTVKIVCPHCQSTFNPQVGNARGQYITAQSGNRYKIKDLIQDWNTPPDHRLYAMMALRSNGEKIYLPIQEEDRALYREATNRLSQADLPLPTMAVRSGHNTDQARGYNYLQWRDFFNDRQLLCLGLLLQEILKIENQAIQEQFICLFSSTLEFNNLFCSFKGEGTGAVRHMFSHHILKPERTPLENCVWGTAKSSGTFATLFESRLIPAKRYLDHPFEISMESTTLSKAMSKKVQASQAIDVTLVDAWRDFETDPQASLILNGSSDALPIPDAVVDLVITDPPYFDFIHYSELSDFFFAWLSPILKQKYAFFQQPNSSHPGEVQHQDPTCFARQLGQVFQECHRVLKLDGLLIFSFHHSQPEGWMAIYEAITNGGFIVVAAHPVHAEMKGTSAKSATKEPINLDAILVCRKSKEVVISAIDFVTAQKNARELETRLESGGIGLSMADRFVILASQLLVGACDQLISIEEMSVLLKQAHQSP
jgi:putative DNA methylase